MILLLALLNDESTVQRLTVSNVVGVSEQQRIYRLLVILYNISTLYSDDKVKFNRALYFIKFWSIMESTSTKEGFYVELAVSTPIQLKISLFFSTMPTWIWPRWPFFYEPLHLNKVLKLFEIIKKSTPKFQKQLLHCTVEKFGMSFLRVIEKKSNKSNCSLSTKKLISPPAKTLNLLQTGSLY